MSTAHQRWRSFATVVVACGGLACVRAEPAAQPAHAAAPQTPTDAPIDNLSRAVGDDALAIVSSPDRVTCGALALVAADDAADSGALEALDRVSGYPVIGSLLPLDADKTSSIARALMDWNNYDCLWRSRCQIERIVGYRFTQGAEHVDVALTDPCGLAMWTAARDGHRVRWGCAFNRELAEHLVAAAIQS